MTFYVRGGGDRLGASSLVTTGAGLAANAVIPGSGAIVSTAVSLFGGLFGGGGTVDQQRMQKVAYFYNLANGGNVGAAQIIAGAIPDVSGNEQPYWQHALQQLATTNPAVSQAAIAAGPKDLKGAGDTATNYPAAQAYALNWAANNNLLTAAAPASVFPSVPVPAAATVRAAMLPGMTTTAGYNWLPVVAGVSVVAGVAALVLSRPQPRRR